MKPTTSTKKNFSEHWRINNMKQRMSTTTETNELSRLLCAAVVSPRFRNQLLKDPEAALRNGYQSESFHLTAEEQSQVLSARVENLADFASHLVNDQSGFVRPHIFANIPVEMPAEAVLGSAFAR
jgi:hypothetical protein